MLAYANGALARWRGWRHSAVGGLPVRVHLENSAFWVDTYFRVWEEETLERVARVVRSGTKFCDVGAWVGPISIFAAKLGAEVTCFEPDPAAYERLLFNLRMNAAGRAVPFNLALGAVDGIRRLAPLAKELGQSGSSLYAPENKEESARVLVLSWTSAVRLLELPAFDVVKIDIEGAEAELLPDMMPWLRQHRPHLLLATHWRFIPEDRKETFVETLRELAAIYPRSRGINLDTVSNGFPSLCFDP